MAIAQTSELGGFVRGLANEIDAASAPVDTAATRIGVVNNLAHLCDSQGQYVVQTVALVSTDMQLSSPSTTVFYRVPGCQWSVPLRLRSGDGSTFRLVIYMRAMISAAGTATFRIALRPNGARTAPLDPAIVPATYWASVSTTNTTGEDLTCTLYYDADGIRLLPLVGSPSVDGSGDGMVANEYAADLEVWAKSSAGASLPTVLALAAREFAGDR